MGSSQVGMRRKTLNRATVSDQAKSAAAWPLGADALSLRSICIYYRICPQARKRGCQ